MTGRPPALGPAERGHLLALARRALEATVAGREPPEVDLADLPEPLRTPAGCFVTLTVEGRLRGCIGNVLPREPLALAVVWSTEGAARRDPRFPPIEATELDRTAIELSVLSPLHGLEIDSPEDLLTRLRPGTDGVLLTVGEQSATFLPHMWERLPDPQQFLEHLAAKAGLPRDAWRRPDATYHTYQADRFSTA